ncbi:hypothetical protein D1970_07845 [Mesobacillus zeae]|uniref:Uncharacterized protein n=1 Tax=Mesobacillus zeae TaxID=1917180 RepID=A0A398BE65_9BACI|nr:hypothetical protein D1970_07845 [Mesobacillus zeae]
MVGPLIEKELVLIMDSSQPTLKDATVFQLPDIFATDYQGSGGSSNTARNVAPYNYTYVMWHHGCIWWETSCEESLCTALRYASFTIFIRYATYYPHIVRCA